MARIINEIKEIMFIAFSESIKYFQTIFRIVNLLISIWLIIDVKETNKTKIILAIVMFIVVEFICWIFKIICEEEKQIPKINKRFTHKNEFNALYVKKSEWQEAIMYLAELEDYIHGN